MNLNGYINDLHNRNKLTNVLQELHVVSGAVPTYACS